MDDQDQVAKRFARLFTMALAGRVMTYKGDGKEYVVIKVFETGMVRILPLGEKDLGIKRSGKLITPDQLA